MCCRLLQGTRLIFIILLLGFSITTSYAQKGETDRKIDYGMLMQMHFSYAQNDSNDNPYGFRLRRLDAKAWSSPTEYFDWSVLIGFDNFFFRILEADVNFEFSNALRFRFGQFAPPAARSGAPVDNLFKVPIMTFIERPPITLNWANNSGLLAYRTFGVQVHGNFWGDKLYYGFMVGNPKGSSYFHASSRNTVHLNEHNGISYWGRLEYKPLDNFVVGVFYGAGSGQTDTIVNSQYSFGGHILYKRNNIAFMAEIIRGAYSVDNSFKEVTTDYSGAFVECGYRIKNIEPALRYDYYVPNKGSIDLFNVREYRNYTIGVNYFLGKKIKIQANYIFKMEIMKLGFSQISNNLFYINLQCLL